jgi:ATP-dependent DNA ligase
MPKFEFCIPTVGKFVPAGAEWFHEIKYDGYRLRIERDGDRVRLITRGGYDWTKRFPCAHRPPYAPGPLFGSQPGRTLETNQP